MPCATTIGFVTSTMEGDPPDSAFALLDRDNVRVIRSDLSDCGGVVE